ncbi:hypothetical protein HBA55_34825 [Pseudomaricurvus alkylphenolicus]|uniref:hypothetical protein n=1 Tax=Pseudomaricurvus alkylphenolicus TaxID=1306991 RepID=UPI00141E9A73|nr:hypothetical protein [Pseudomaricurvus alkylphenolicus]NIB44807.1 hypothetical protein [Pseudomaricurvus alkylphenolicus]
MDIAEQWNVLAFELVLRDNGVYLVVKHQLTGEMRRLSARGRGALRYGSGVSYRAGWLEGAVSVLTGRVGSDNLTEAYSALLEDCENDLPI